MTTPRFDAGRNIAIKIPRDRFEPTVAFYRDVLGFTLEEQDVTDTPTLHASFSLEFGSMTLWLDSVDADRPEVWLELETNDLVAARQQLSLAGVEPCDEIEPFPGVGESSHWIRDPAGVVHLLLAG